QRFAGEAHDAEQPWQALLASALRPVQRRTLRVGIQQDDVLAAQREFAREVRGERGLSDTAFLVEQRDDHGAALRVGKPGFGCCAWCRFAVVHRSGALLLKVMYFLLGMLEGAQSQQWRGFSADFCA